MSEDHKNRLKEFVEELLFLVELGKKYGNNYVRYETFENLFDRYGDTFDLECEINPNFRKTMENYAKT
jgi:hypothetical protein